MPPTKRSAGKKSAGKRSSGSKSARGGKPKCGPRDVCAYLDAWSLYFQSQFLPHYQHIEDAVCNLEKFAIRSLPNTPELQICPGKGGTAEPPPPPKPPSW